MTKIKDLTLEDTNNICKTQANCTKCPLNAKNINCYFMYLESKKYWDKHQDKEIKL